MKHIIYKATNTQNGKSYIGFSKLSLWERHEKHLYDAIERGSDYHFHRALRKYPIDVWEWDTVDECNSRNEAGILEEKYIDKYETYTKGYNSTTGGESAFEMSKESREKLSESRKGIKFSDEHRANLSKALKGRIPWNKGKTGSIPWNKGKARSSECRKSISESMLNSCNVKEAAKQKHKPIIIDGVRYSSRKEAVEVLNVDRKTIYNWLKRGKAVDA